LLLNDLILAVENVQIEANAAVLTVLGSINVIDEYPVVPPLSSQSDRAPGAWSARGVEWQDFGRPGAWLRCADLDRVMHAAPKPWAEMVHHSTGSPRQTPG
jgi:hypothetical protein